MQMPAARPWTERLEEKCMPEPNSGCWLWLAGTYKGYGRLGVDGGSELAHRLMWKRERGSIPAGMHVLHKCDTPACINIDHLFLGTQADNNIDCAQKGRQQSRFRRRNDNEVRAIRADQRPTKEIAVAYGLAERSVLGIRQRVLYPRVL